MESVLILGFLIGLRHAIEADHIAAVASISSQTTGLSSVLKLGAAWGLGHGIMLFSIGASVIILDSALPEKFAQYLELVVGLMLCWLGYDVLRRMIRQRIHFHLHTHQGTTTTKHFHAHSHRDDSKDDLLSSKHKHSHASPKLGKRSFIVGLIHGIAGSSALILITLDEFNSWGPAIIYMLLFGLGTMLGMAILSVIISLPLQRLSKSLTWAHNALNTLTGTATIGLGIWLIYDLGVKQSLFNQLIH